MADPITAFVGKFIADAALASAIGGAVANIAGGLLLSTLGRILAPTPDAPSIKAQIEVPTSLPSKRFVFGLGQKADGTPAPAWVTNKGRLFACYIMNSAASSTISQVVIDGRYGTLDGDPYDFTGPGAKPEIAKIENFTNIWIGRGDQTGPPDDIMDEKGDATSADATKFWPTDAGRGLTVIWARYRKGGDDDFLERWSAVPPQMSAIGDWTKVWDPREAAQDADDPATWTVSSNAWLCILHTLRFNPVARWPLAQLDIDSFIAAANDADATRTRLDASTEARWRIGGTAYFGRSGALMDVIMPMVDATGGDILISGEGLSAIPAKAQTPAFTVTDWIGGTPAIYRARQEGGETYNAVQASWPQPEANFEMQTLEPAEVPGRTWSGGDADLEAMDLSFVPFPAQAMHLQAIRARRQALGREHTLTLGPDFYASGAQAGDWITVDLPTGWTGRNGTFEVTQVGEFDLALMTQTVTAREIAASVYGFTAADDEQPVYDATFVEAAPTLDPVTSVTLSVSTQGLAPSITVEIEAPETLVLRRSAFEVMLLDALGEVEQQQTLRLAGDVTGAQTLETTFGNLDADTAYEVTVTAASAGLRSTPVSATATTGAGETIVDAGVY